MLLHVYSKLYLLFIIQFQLRNSIIICHPIHQLQTCSFMLNFTVTFLLLLNYVIFIIHIYKLFSLTLLTMTFQSYITYAGFSASLFKLSYFDLQFLLTPLTTCRIMQHRCHHIKNFIIFFH